MLRFFYDLWFVYENEIGTHSFHIGYFSTIKKVKNAVAFLKNQPGFCDHPIECFEYPKFGLHIPTCQSKEKTSLFVPSCEYEEDGFDCWSIFGVFVSEKEAEEEIKKQLRKKKYRQHKDDFMVENWVVDLDLDWREGFTSY